MPRSKESPRGLSPTSSKRMAIPPLHALVALEAAARLRSLTRAALELNVTPSAISHRIRVLEDRIGVKLFRRIGRDYQPTEIGVEYVQTVRQALDSLNRFPASSSGRAKALEPVDVAVPPTFARIVLIPRLVRFFREHPEIELRMHLSIPLLHVSAVDPHVEIRFGSGIYRGVVAHPLLDEEVFPVCSPGYFAECGPCAEPAKLMDAVLLHSPLEPWQPWLTAAGVDRAEPEGPQFGDLGLLLEAAASGYGIALARSSLAAPMLASGRLVRASRIVARPHYSYHLVYNAEVKDRPEVALFISWLTKAFTPDENLRR